jgi:uncharacterized lipoprotein YmbA
MMNKHVKLAARLGMSIAMANMLLMLTGCFGSSPSTRYYALDTTAHAGNNVGPKVAMGPFQLPDYLNRPQIVTREEGEKLRIHEYDRWAESLEYGISRRVSNVVSVRLDNAFVYEFIRTTSYSADYRVYGQIIKFEATPANEVVLVIAWDIVRDGQATRGPIKTIKRRSLPPDADMNDIVSAMGDVLDEFGVDVAAAVSRTLAAAAADESAD